MKPERKFHYVYILRSLSFPSAHYTGSTQDLHDRLARHNAGAVPHTASLRPWCIETAVAFADSAKATSFERYLKSGSGRAFAQRHF